MKLNRIIVFAAVLCLVLLSISILSYPQESGLEAYAQAQSEEAVTTEGNADKTQNNTVPEGMVKVAENEFLEMYIDKASTVVAVKDKKTGAVWKTNPEGRNDDPLASGHARNLLNSQIEISYYNMAGQLLFMNNYFDSIQYGQFEISEIQNGIRITYTIGRQERIFVVPRAISVERMESEILNHIPEDQRRPLLRNYVLTDLDKIADEGRRTQLLEQFPTLEEYDLYLLPEDTSPIIKNRIEEIILLAGYTIEEMNAEHLLHNIPPDEPRRDIFTIPLEYTIDGDNLVVRIATGEIVYHEDFPLYSIRLLEFFGAADTDQEGYMLVPDGSGALINLNNNKQHFEPFSVQVYGRDYSIPLTELSEMSYQAYLPVYGLVKDNRAFFTIIERGAPLATIRANVSRRMTSYNSVFSEFTTIPTSVLDVGAFSGINIINVHQERIFQGDIQLRFSFLYGNEASYVGMAHEYQEYLIKRYNLDRIDTDEDVPLFINTVGAVDLRGSFLGMPINRVTALTTYDQAIEILQSFKDEGINNLNLRFTGWFNGGVRHTLPMRLNHIAAIGGRQGLQRLQDFTARNAIRFFPDVALNFVHADGLFDGFNPRSHASRLLSRPIARIEGFNPATLDTDGDQPVKHVLSPVNLPRVINSIVYGFNDMNITGISVRDVGFSLNSDFKLGALVDRQQASDILAAGVERLKDVGLNILLSGGNANVLPFADALVNMPMRSNQRDIVDHCVPFFQIVFRGFLEFAGAPVNLTGNPRIQLLRAIETGAGLQYTFIYADNELLKRSDYQYMFSANFRDWFDSAKKDFELVNRVTGDIQGERITGHSIIAPGVHKTTFEGGRQIIVNYTTHAVEFEGRSIEGENYLIFKEGD